MFKRVLFLKVSSVVLSFSCFSYFDKRVIYSLFVVEVVDRNILLYYGRPEV